MPFANLAARQFALKATYFAFLVCVSLVAILPLCDFVYQCGCKVWWRGAAAHCNMHHPGVKHCPFCTVPWVYEAIVSSIVLSQGWLVWRGSWLWAFFAFPLLGLFSLLVLGVITGYW